MKKLLVLLAVVFSVLAFSGCIFDECKHYSTKEKIFEPNCTDEGYTQRTCKTCGYKYKFNFVEPVGHSLSANFISPTCTDQGYTAYGCDVCDYVYNSDFVEPSGHSYTHSTVEPTCDEGGYTTYTCRCGYSYNSLLRPSGTLLPRLLPRPSAQARVTPRIPVLADIPTRATL